MQILFLYPAKAYLLTATRKPRLMYTGQTFAVFDGLNIYVKTGENPRFAYQESEGHNTYALQVAPDIFVSITSSYSDDAFLERIYRQEPDFPAGIIARAKAVLSDMEGYNARLKVETEARNEARNAEDAIREQARLARDAETAEKAAQAQLEAEARFKAGERISWLEFETACKKYGVKMAGSTTGSGRKRVTTIGEGSASINGKGPLGDGVWIAVRSLKRAMLEGA